MDGKRSKVGRQGNNYQLQLLLRVKVYYYELRTRGAFGDFVVRSKVKEKINRPSTRSDTITLYRILSK